MPSKAGKWLCMKLKQREGERSGSNNQSFEFCISNIAGSNKHKPLRSISQKKRLPKVIILGDYYTAISVGNKHNFRIWRSVAFGSKSTTLRQSKSF